MSGKITKKLLLDLAWRKTFLFSEIWLWLFLITASNQSLLLHFSQEAPIVYNISH
jgi:hypothetical protein